VPPDWDTASSSARAHLCSTSTAAIAVPGASAAQRSQHGAAIGAERSLGRALPLAGAQAEAHQRCDQAARTAAAQVDGDELAAPGVAADEEGLDDSQRASGLHALDRAHEPAFTLASAAKRYLGAWSAGAFTVLIAMGSEDSETAVAMAVIVLLANGILQQMIQPIAYGAALGIHPLAVLIVTIAGGSLFGGIGLVLAAPLTAAIVRISAVLAGARGRR